MSYEPHIIDTVEYIGDFYNFEEDYDAVAPFYGLVLSWDDDYVNVGFTFMPHHNVPCLRSELKLVKRRRND